MGNDWIFKGNDFFKIERFEEAIQSYNQALKIEPKNASVWNNRGLCFDNLGRHEEAIQCYKNALEINPQNTHAWCNLGISLNSLKQFEKALTCFDKALEFNSKHVLSWQKKGDSLHNLGRDKEAVHCYTLAVKFDPDNILAWYSKGVCEDVVGLNAFLSYSNVMALGMGFDSEFVIKDGNAFLEVRHIERIKIKQEYLKYAIKRMGDINTNRTSTGNQKKTVNYPASAKALPSPILLPRNKASSIIVKNKQKQSDADIYSLDANEWYMKGKQLCDLEDYQEAIRCFDNALQLEPQYVYAWREKAFCEENLGSKLDAIFSYKQLLKFADDEPELIQSAIASLAKLERDQSLSVNQKEKSGGQIPKINGNAAENSVDLIYQPGDIIGQEYEVRSLLGKGGFGEVYLVYARELAIECALKTFQDKFLTDLKTRDRFRKEVKVLIELEHHPYIVRTYAANKISGRLFIVMEYIAPNKQGSNSLAGYLQNRPQLAQSLHWAIQICFGMEYAYLKGVRAHRDIKPDNIMISQDGTAKITDFGLAGTLDVPPANPSKLTSNIGLFGRTQIGTGFGTPSHMPPEQFINASHCDERSDIYSFGIVLFQMASGGKLPFLTTPPRDEWRDWLRLHNEAPIPLLNSPLFPIIQRCLEKKPDNRYQSFSRLRLDLEPMLKKLCGEVISQPLLGKLTVNELNNKGGSLATLGCHEDALNYFNQALKLDPHHVRTLGNKGLCLDELGSYEEAIRYCDMALEIEPGNVPALNNKGRSLYSLRHFKEAVHYYDKVLEIDPRNLFALNNKGRSLNSLSRYKEAIDYYDKVFEIDPSYISAMNNKADCLKSLNRHEEAIQYSDKVLEIDPYNIYALNNKGSCLNSLGNHKEALCCYDKVLEIDSGHVMALYSKGGCLGNLGSYEEAILYYDEVLKIDPRDIAVLSNKGLCLKNLVRYEEAIRCYDNILEIDPVCVEALYDKGICLVNLIRYKEAICYFEKILEIAPYNLGAWINKADCLYFLGQKLDAIRSYRQFIELAPIQEEKFIEYARQQIHELAGK